MTEVIIINRAIAGERAAALCRMSATAVSNLSGLRGKSLSNAAFAISDPMLAESGAAAHDAFAVALA